MMNSDLKRKSFARNPHVGFGVPRRESLLCKGMLVGAVALCASVLHANVFDDAKAWYRGAYDGNGNGKFVDNKGCFRDVLHAADPTHVNHGVTIQQTSTGSDILIQNMDVLCPYRNETLTNTPCLYFQNPVEKIGEVEVGGKTREILKNNPSYLKFPSLFSDYPGTGSCSNYTAVMRVRYDQATEDCKGVHSALLSIGLSWTQGADVGLSLSLEKDDTTATEGGLNRRLRYSSGSEFQYDLDSWSETSSTVAAPHIPTNRWIDIAVAVNGSEVTVGYTWDDDLTFREGATSGPDTHDNRRIRWWTKTGLTKCTPAYKRNRNITFGGEATGSCVFTNGVDKGGNQRKAFRGALHQLALWHRTLSKEEMLEAMGDGRPSAFRIGLEGKSSAVFTKQVTEVDSNGRWEDLNNELTTANPSATVRFVYTRPYDKKVSQLLRVKLASESASGKLRVTVNDRPAKNDIVITPGRAQFAFVPASCFETGTNRLTVTRIDGGSSALVLDTMELFGGWQRGNDNFKGKLEMVSEAAAGNELDLADGSLYHIKRCFLPASTVNNKEIIRFNVPAELAGDIRSTVMFQTGQDRSLSETTPFHITLNGTEVYSHPSLDWSQTHTVKLRRDALRAGQNELVFECTGGKGWINLSSWRFSYDGLPSGLMLIFR